MTYEQIFKAIKNGNIRSVYVLYGPETYVRDSVVAALRRKLLPEGFETLNESVWEGSFSVIDLMDSAEMLPLMGERRLVLVKNWSVLTASKTRKKKDETESTEEESSPTASSSETDRLIQWLAHVPDTCCLVFTADDAPDPRKKLVQTLKSIAEWVSFDPLSDADILKWCQKRAQACDHDILPEAVSQLLFMVGRSLTTLETELDKLIAYTGGGAVITKQDVEAIVTPSSESKVFDMIDLLLRGQSAKAHMQLKQLLEQGEKPVGIIALLTRQLRILAHVRILRDQGITLPEIERRLSVNHYALERAAGQAARFSAATLENGYRACVEADYAFKSGQIRENIALEQLMLTLAAMK